MQVFTQVVELFSTDHGNIGLWYNLSLFNLSLCCHSCTVLMQAVLSLYNAEDKNLPLPSPDCWGEEKGGIFTSCKIFSFCCHRSKLRPSHFLKSCQSAMSSGLPQATFALRRRKWRKSREAHYSVACFLPQWGLKLLPGNHSRVHCFNEIPTGASCTQNLPIGLVSRLKKSQLSG